MPAKVYEEVFNRILKDFICQIKPTTIGVGTTVIYSRRHKNTSEAYLADRITFPKVNSNYFIRAAFPGEFDATPKFTKHYMVQDFPPGMKPSMPTEFFDEMWRSMPPLWCSVTRIDKGIHQVTSLYRGDLNVPTIAVDGISKVVKLPTLKLAELVVSLQESEGWDRKAFQKSFAGFWNRALAFSAVLPALDGKVN